MGDFTISVKLNYENLEFASEFSFEASAALARESSVFAGGGLRTTGGARSIAGKVYCAVLERTTGWPLEDTILRSGNWHEFGAAGWSLQSPKIIEIKVYYDTETHAANEKKTLRNDLERYDFLDGDSVNLSVLSIILKQPKLTYSKQSRVGHKSKWILDLNNNVLLTAAGRFSSFWVNPALGFHIIYLSSYFSECSHAPSERTAQTSNDPSVEGSLRKVSKSRDLSSSEEESVSHANAINIQTKRRGKALRVC
ncbi:uncharacterized protein H6S33_013144 [Morchella sextelata]|uniref:uncharacterized protein n=1 Tax=Morchella sextelata TaxID=1174677 RepID=UPI001D036B39|nr:uncharacterized protein H6S33_013144 [Morchella sextelata]KAH0609658.1 hypothetical protein H6S33_013144 [Morchella sextelata]